MTTQTGAKILVECLEKEGVEYFFGVPGGASLSLYDALKDSKINVVLTRHEQSASFMAYAYTRLTGTPSVCHGTTGPGSQNLVTGIAEAWGGCVPVIAIGSGVNMENEGKGLLQEFPLTRMFSTFTKEAIKINSVSKIPWFIRRAFQVAFTGKPGPVFLEFPADIASSMAETQKYVPSIRPVRYTATHSDIETIVKMIRSSSHPILVAGGGVYLSQAFQELEDLAELLSTPVLTSATGKGSIREDHDLSAGLLGAYRTKFSKNIWESADLIISFGCRFEAFESGFWKWYPKNAKLIQIDIDPNELGKNWSPDLGVASDAKTIMSEIADFIKENNVAIKNKWDIKKLVDEKKNYFLNRRKNSSAYLQSSYIISEARNVFGRNTILCLEHGSQDFWAYPDFPVFEPGTCLAPTNQTCMGLSVAGCIGAKFAKPDFDVVCITGDGAFQMMSQEIITAVQYNTPITWCVLNNNCLGWMKFTQAKKFNNRFISSDFTSQPDFTAFANSMGCFGKKVTSANEVKLSLEEARNKNQEGISAIIEFVVNDSDLPEGFLEFSNL